MVASTTRILRGTGSVHLDMVHIVGNYPCANTVVLSSSKSQLVAVAF